MSSSSASSSSSSLSGAAKSESMVRVATERASRRIDLDAESMEAAMRELLAGEATPAQIAGLAIALRTKGETPVEIAAAVQAMRAACSTVELAGKNGVLFDTCGTGGDGAGTFNVSTMAAVVVASCGVSIAKHGNRAISSRCGSADLLEAMGVRIDLPTSRLKEVFEELGIAFLFAPAHHGALRHAAAVRKELGIRTFFNLLGPLANPAHATHQVLGVYDPARVEMMANVLGLLGTKAAWVVHGNGGLDEISPSGPTRVAALEHGSVRSFELHPSDFGIEPFDVALVGGGDASMNADLAWKFLRGEQGPRRDVVLINAAAALTVARKVDSPLDGMRMARDAVDSGSAERTMNRWIEESQKS